MRTEEADGPRSDVGAAPQAKLSLIALTALVVGSMIGGGIFALPSQMAEAAAPGPLIIGWLITGVGMLMLAFVFQTLAKRKPDVDGGVYGYARAGFGNYIGFTSAWGYWLSAFIGNVGYLVLLFATLGYFFPIFAEGGSAIAGLIGASILLWIVHFVIMRGVQEAAFVNTVVTIAKIVPLVTFVGILAFAFKADLFTFDFWGASTEINGAPLGSTMDQIKNMMLVTVWVFIGIEGASIYGSRAKKRSDVGRATVLGFIAVLALLLLVNLLSYAAMSRVDIAQLPDPSTAGVLAHVVGPWGAGFISVGLILSLLGALVSWFLLCAEILRAPAVDGVLPRFLDKVNAGGTPTGAMWLTTGATQLMLIYSAFNESGYKALILLASSLILLPYLWSALYQVILAARGEGYQQESGRGKELVIGVIALIYAIWLVYAGGIGYVLIAALFYLVGTGLYVWARRENHQRLFARYELAVFTVIVGLSIWAVIALANGTITV